MKKILIVDDTATVRMFQKMLLKNEGFEIEQANNGKEALDTISTFSPDLVLLDIIMPEMDGIECCKRIKEKEETKNIKVIMVTTKGEYDKVKEAFAVGCDDYLTKPIRKMELITKIRHQLK